MAELTKDTVPTEAVPVGVATRFRQAFTSRQDLAHRVYPHTHFFGASLESSAVEDSLLACPALGIDFDSCSLDIGPFGLFAALSLAVSAGLVPVAVGGGVSIAGGVLASGGDGALETGSGGVVCGGGDGLSPQEASVAAAVIAISRSRGRIIWGSRFAGFLGVN